MSDKKSQVESGQQTTVVETTSQSPGLAAALEATQEQREKVHKKLPKARRDQLDEWWQALIGLATSQDFKLDGTALRSVEKRIAEIDEEISKQLAAVMHHEEFQKLEGTWTGLKRFVNNTEIEKNKLEIHVFNCSKEELADDFKKAGKPHESDLYQKTVFDQYQKFGGVPFGILIGDYQWSGHPSDIATLTDFAKVASASHTSIITSPSPELFGMDSWEQLQGHNSNTLADIFESPECIEWRNFRNSEESRYVTMAMPRTMARLPYGNGPSNTAVKEFRFEELPIGEEKRHGGEGENIERPSSEFCWSNAAFALGERVTESFFIWGWTTSIRGVENGGLVRELPLYKYISPAGDTKVKCPSEFSLNHHQEFSLSNRGFCPLEYYLEQNYSVFAGGQTAHKPRDVVQQAAQESENLSARLPYMLAVSRVAHFCKAIAHDKVGSFLAKTDAEKWLNDWIMTYVEKGENPSDEIKRRKPFKNAHIEVQDKAGDPGFYEVKIMLAPWIQFEGMTTDFTLVADIESAKAQKAK